MRDIQAPSIDAPASEWLVYGDALQEAGDPRGELIGLSHAVDEGRTEATVRDAYVKDHAAALLGEAAPHLAAYRFDWRFCVPVGVEVRVGPDDRELVGPLLASPLAAELRSIRLVGVTKKKRVDLAPSMKLLAEHLPAHCRSFAFVDQRAADASMLVSRDFDPNTNLVQLGPLAPFLAVAERMELVAADSHQLGLDNVDAPHLVSFVLNSLRFSDWEEAETMASRLGAAKWPKLENFELRLVETWFANIPFENNPYIPVYSEPDEDDEDEDGSSRYDDEAEDGDSEGIDWSVLGDLLGTLSRCPLRRLALTSFESSDSLMEALESAGLAPSVEELVLSDSSFGDQNADWMVANKAVFAGVKKLVAERTPLTERGIAKLKTLGMTVVHSPGSGAYYRYMVGQE